MSKWFYVQTGQAISETGPDLGLDRNALRDIFLSGGLGGANDRYPHPVLPDACPPAGRAYHAREYGAFQFTFESLRNGTLTLPSPFSGAGRVHASGMAALAFTPGQHVVPLAYSFGSDETRFLAVVAALTGRITQVIIPSLHIIVHELNSLPAEKNLAEIESGFPLAFERGLPALNPDGKKIAIVDMVNNHGHHLINHLSGIQRLIDLGVHDHVDEIWTQNISFFGSFKVLFPEIKEKFRHFESKTDLQVALNDQDGLRVRIGSNYFTKGLAERVQRYAGPSPLVARTAPTSRVLAVTMRGGLRICENLADCIASIYDQSTDAGLDLKIIIDGWVIPESSVISGSPLLTYLRSPYKKPIDAEFEMADEITKRLPPDAVLANVIGRSMADSIAILRQTNAYFAHIGTLQHKLGYLTNAEGLVHGPKDQITSLEAGTFLTECGKVPQFISPQIIEDIPDSGGTRGNKSNSYRISNPDVVGKQMTEILMKATASDS
jgi:hypothetical protein